MRNTLTLIAAFCAMALLLAALVNSSPVAAQTADTPTPVPTAEQPSDFGTQNLPPIEGKLNPSQYPNLDSNLNRIVGQVQTGLFSARAAAANAPIHDEQSVGVTFYVAEGYAQDVWDYLEERGASPRNIGADYIEAYVPVSLLPEASQQEGVISVRTIIPPQPAQGTVVSDGAALHGAPAWHAAGLKGQGVKIGIIDAGFYGFQRLMGTELPSSAQARCYTDVGVFTSNLADCDYADAGVHGTAVTEAAFDIAPQATYYIASYPFSRGDLQSTVNWMVAENVDVINMSLAWEWDGPGDGTSPYSDSSLRSVDAAVAGGIVFANSAGNEADATWFGQFTDANGDNLHEFSGTDNCNNYAARDNSGQILPIIFLREVPLYVQLRWDDTWGGADTDLDLILARWNETTGRYESYVTSELEQSGGTAHTPFEIIGASVPAGAYCIAIRRDSGPNPSWVQIQDSQGITLQHHTLHHSIGSPAESANPGLLAVGAAPTSDTNAIESYSSQGPTPDGRTKPDIVGVARGQSVSYRSEYSPDGRWAGTSQSSPHVAALAALVKQRFPHLSPPQVAGYLKSHAAERGEAGRDNVWGHGFARLRASEASPSSDATLRSLSLSGITLVPEFDPATTAYTADANALATTTVEAVAAHPAATVTGDGVKNLVEGENVISVVVTAEDKTTRTYTVTVTATDVPNLLGRYDTNDNERIDDSELSTAITDFSSGRLSASELSTLITIWSNQN